MYNISMTYVASSLSQIERLLPQLSTKEDAIDPAVGGRVLVHDLSTCIRPLETGLSAPSALADSQSSPAALHAHRSKGAFLTVSTDMP
jgi:ribulose 1,5-bisphosphate carboxylase large subunit-like protein